ncbi:hypothetical protein [Ferrimicrobium sp.]|nr:hypothetical protein [Ferrimicrobium sp.]
MRAYLMTDSLFADRFEKMFTWMDWPERLAGERDTGIDLVGIERDGGVCVTQCKFVAAGTTIAKPAIDSFLAASSRQPLTARFVNEVDRGEGGSPVATGGRSVMINPPDTKLLALSAILGSNQDPKRCLCKGGWEISVSKKLDDSLLAL